MSLPRRFTETLREPSSAFTWLFGAGTVAVLCADALHPDPTLQTALGVLAFGILFVLTVMAPADERRMVWACVAVATLLEIYGSIVWGVYRYRLHNIPLYVPPGHGLVYLASFRLSRLPLFAARPRRTVAVAVGIAVAFAVAGVTLEPLLLHRIDIFGAFWCVYFVTFSVHTRRGVFFAAVFLVTSLLEIVGTATGDWTWAVTDPVFGIGSGNPPSVIAGGYCVLEATVIIVTRAGARLARRRGDRRAASPREALSATGG